MIWFVGGACPALLGSHSAIPPQTHLLGGSGRGCDETIQGVIGLLRQLPTRRRLRLLSLLGLALCLKLLAPPLALRIDDVALLLRSAARRLGAASRLALQAFVRLDLRYALRLQRGRSSAKT
eukprot:scaffold116543_cov28-Tisochrysis_lutea.AAC.2